MLAHARRGLLALAALALVGSSGCDLQTMAYFLMPEAREPARILHLASKDPKKVPHVVILTYHSGLEARAEFIHADRQLAELLAQQLKALASGYEEKLEIVPQRKVEDYKNSHPNWKDMGLRQIGRAFAADYVIYLEINSLSLYEKNSYHELLRGRADITVSLADVKDPDDGLRQETFNCLYPSDARGPITVGFDAHPAQFRLAFLKDVARQLAWYFSSYPKREQYKLNGPGL
jgi:hypothetical protein